MATRLAKDLAVGDFLVGLDNGYVVDIEPDPDWRDGHNVGYGHGMIGVTFHDQQGEENYMILNPETNVEVA